MRMIFILHIAQLLHCCSILMCGNVRFGSHPEARFTLWVSLYCLSLMHKGSHPMHLILTHKIYVTLVKIGNKTHGEG